MLPGRYESHIQEDQELIRRIFMSFGSHLFHIFKILDFKIPSFPKVICFNMIRDFYCIVRSRLVGPELTLFGFGSHGHVHKSENHANDGFSGFPQNEKVTSPK